MAITTCQTSGTAVTVVWGATENYTVSFTLTGVDTDARAAFTEELTLARAQ